MIFTAYSHYMTSSNWFRFVFRYSDNRASLFRLYSSFNEAISGLLGKTTGLSSMISWKKNTRTEVREWLQMENKFTEI